MLNKRLYILYTGYGLQIEFAVRSLIPFTTFTSSLRISSYSSKCLNIPSNNQVIGQIIQQSDCTNGDSQMFTFLPTSINGFYIIKASKGLCLDLLSYSTTNGSPVGLNTCNNGDNQKWAINDLANNLFEVYSYYNKNKCIYTSGASTTNGNQIQIWDCNTQLIVQTLSFVSPILSGDQTTFATFLIIIIILKLMQVWKY